MRAVSGASMVYGGNYLNTNNSYEAKFTIRLTQCQGAKQLVMTLTTRFYAPIRLHPLLVQLIHKSTKTARAMDSFNDIPLIAAIVAGFI